jgi:zinc and cadmium transporter
MDNLLPILGLVTLGSVLGLSGGILMISKKSLRNFLSIHSIPFAAGVMLAVSLLDVLPEAIEGSDAHFVLKVVLIVMVIAFFFEQFFLHIHHHDEHQRTTIKSSMPLVVAGDTIHNFIDGMAIAAAYLVEPTLGLLVALATFLHELPHEMGDFGLMLSAGWSKTKVIVVNLVSSLATYLGAFFVILFSESLALNLGLLLGIAGGLFLYIAASDLLPEVHDEHRDSPWHQALLLLLGVGVVWLMTSIFPHSEI